MGLFKDLKNVELFRVGSWKGTPYTRADLESMVKAYDKVGFVPPVKSGHAKDSPGLPALGWIENLRCVDDRLVADFNRLYPEVYEAIKDRRYTAVSSEVYINYQHQDGTVFPKVLKACAILGQDVPAVKNLKPLHELLSEGDDTKAEKVEIYDVELFADEDENSIPKVAEFAATGIKFVIGKLKGSDKTTVQTVLFDKEQWSVNKARAWLSSHSLHSGKVDSSEKGMQLRFRQRNPGDFETMSFRTIEPGMQHSSIDDCYVVYQETIKKEEVKMEFEDRLKELEEKFAKVISTKDAEITGLQTKIETLSAELTKAKEVVIEFSETDAGKEVAKLQQQLEETKAQLNTTVQKFAESEKKSAELEEASRKEKIAKKTNLLKIPALRPYVEIFYDKVTKVGGAEVVNFSADGQAKKDMKLEEIMDGFVSALNKVAETELFSEFGEDGTHRREDGDIEIDDPGVEVDKRIRVYCAKNNLDVVKNYDVALKAVFAEDPKLKTAYVSM